MTVVRSVVLCVFVIGSVIGSFVRELSRSMDIGNVCATIGNVLAAFLAPSDGCIDSPLVCGNC